MELERAIAEIDLGHLIRIQRFKVAIYKNDKLFYVKKLFSEIEYVYVFFLQSSYHMSNTWYVNTRKKTYIIFHFRILFHDSFMIALIQQSWFEVLILIFDFLRRRYGFDLTIIFPFHTWKKNPFFIRMSKLFFTFERHVVWPNANVKYKRTCQ